MLHIVYNPIALPYKYLTTEGVKNKTKMKSEISIKVHDRVLCCWTYW